MEKPVTLYPSAYSHRLSDIHLWVQNKRHFQPHMNILDEIGYIAIGTYIHIVLVTYFIGELYGWTAEVHAKMKRLMDFYKIDEVEGYKCE